MWTRPTRDSTEDTPPSPTGEKLLCLTLDLENDWQFEDPALDHCVFDYLDMFDELLSSLDVPLSVFVVGQTLERHPEAVDRIRTGSDCEFHLHSYRHSIHESTDFEEEVRLGTAAYREFFGHDPVGYRAPQGDIAVAEFETLREFGFEFDSSVYPSFRPGTYNNLTAPLEPYRPETAPSLLEIPIGAFPGVRIPIVHSYFKLLGPALSRYLSVASLPDIVVYDFHLHDLYETASHDELRPFKRWIMKRNIDDAEALLHHNVETLLERGYEPVTMTELYETVVADGGSE